MKTEVSIVIPLFNKEKYIHNAILSIQKQDFQNWECIIINDGSTDKSALEVNKVKDQRIRLYTQENRGPGYARNRGVELCSSRIVTFLDADDIWYESYLSRQVEIFSKHKNITASTFGHIRSNIRTIDKIVGKTETGVFAPEINKSPEDIKRLTDFMHSGSTAILKSDFLKLGGFYEKNHCTYGEDSYLWLQVLLFHYTYRNPEPLMEYNIEGSELGISRKTMYPCWPKISDSKRIFENCDPEKHNRLRKILSYYSVLHATRCYRNGKLLEAIKTLNYCKKMYPIFLLKIVSVSLFNKFKRLFVTFCSYFVV